MLIQNSGSPAMATRLAVDGAPVLVSAPPSNPLPADLVENISSAATGQPTSQPEPTPAQLQSAVNNINKSLKQLNSNLEFSIDEDTHKTVVKVVESETGTVIRQFPSEEALAISRALDQMQQLGVLFEQQA